MCNIFVHSALAWFALGQKLNGDAIGAAGRLNTPNDYLCWEILIHPAKKQKKGKK